MSTNKFTPEGISAYYAVRVPQLNQATTGEWRGHCPIHHGKNSNNFAVKSETGEWYCFSACGKGGDILKLEQELTGADFPTCKDAVLQIIGTSESEYSCDGSPAGDMAGAPASQPAKTDFPFHQWTEVERYAYEDIDGKVTYEMVRYLKPDAQKDFRPCRPDGKGGVIWNLHGIERVPYRLQKLLDAKTVYLPEGEKDVHTLEKLGLVGSCNPGGSGSSQLYNSWAKYFSCCDVVILPDNDEPGRKHAGTVAAALLGVALSVRIVEIPGLPPKGDVTDWWEKCHTREELCKLTEAAVPLDLAALSALRKSWGLAAEKAHQKGSASVLATRRVSDIEAKPVSWLWQGRMARGKVSFIAGDPGLGKSQITSSIAAIVTTGGIWPVEQQQCEVGNVIFLSAEDDPADTLRPRLEAAGADLDRIHVVDGVGSGSGDNNKAFSLKEDLQALDKRIEGLGNVAAVVIDPISAYLGGVDSHKDADIRALLAPLAELAARHNTAIICISHLNKAAGGQALLRVMGSVGFVAVARAAFLVAADPQDPARRLFLPIKNNIGVDDKGFAFHIETATVPSPAGPLLTSRVVWESEAVSLTANEVLKSGVATQGVSALTDAKEWLLAALADGPVAVTTVQEEAKVAGITSATLRRAKKELSVLVQKQKGAINGGWQWSIPPKALNIVEDVQQKSLSTFGDLEHLQDMADKL